MILNYTPHTINIGEKVIASSGNARITQSIMPTHEIDGIQVIKTFCSNVTGLPEPQKGVYLIVSLMVQEALPNRMDLLSPGELIRNETGQIIGCKNLKILD